MMKYIYLVHGAGRQGTATVYDLVKNCEAKEVRVVDPNEVMLRVAASRIRGLQLYDGAALGFSTLPDYENVDVILSCAPYSANLALTKDAISNGVHFCDLGGNPETVRQQVQAAKDAKTAVVPECGVSPGLSNILATHMAKQGAEDIKVRCGGIPVDPNVNQLGYKLVFSASGLLSEYMGQVPIIKDGAIEYVKALSTEEQYDGSLIASPTSNNAPEVVETLLGLGVKNYSYMTLRHPGHWKAMKCIMMLGLTEEQLIEKLDKCKALQYNPETDTDRLILAVTGMRFDGITTSWEYTIDIKACSRTKFSAMELMTSWGITLVAHQIAASQKVVPGFWTPEKHINRSKIISDLNRRLMEHE